MNCALEQYSPNRLELYNREGFSEEDINHLEKLLCKDKRQNGLCDCVHRYIFGGHSPNMPHEDGPKFRFCRVKFIHQEAASLKSTRNPVAGRKYSEQFGDYVKKHQEELTNKKLCKKAITQVLHCSLNFLYRDPNNNKKKVPGIKELREKRCCEKSCLQKLIMNEPGVLEQQLREMDQHQANEVKRKVFYNLQKILCLKAIGEVTGQSKATLNSLNSKTSDAIHHKLKDRRRLKDGPIVKEEPTDFATFYPKSLPLKRSNSVQSNQEIREESPPYQPQQVSVIHSTSVLQPKVDSSSDDEIQMEPIARYPGHLSNHLGGRVRLGASSTQGVSIDYTQDPLLDPYGSSSITGDYIWHRRYPVSPASPGSSTHSLVSPYPAIMTAPSSAKRRPRKMPGLIPIDIVEEDSPKKIRVVDPLRANTTMVSPLAPCVQKMGIHTPNIITPVPVVVTPKDFCSSKHSSFQYPESL